MSPCTIAKVLVADDDQFTREFVGMILRKMGFDICEASDGQEAYERIRHEHPDIIVSDIMMPIMDGWALCRKLRAEGYETPFIFLSNRHECHDVERLMISGGTAYIPKPRDPGQLEAQLERALRKHYRPLA